MCRQGKDPCPGYVAHVRGVRCGDISEDDLEKILHDNADEPFAHGIAKSVLKTRKGIMTTTALADAVRRAFHPARRVSFVVVQSKNHEIING